MSIRAMTMVAWAAIAAAPAVVGAQATTPPPTLEGATCDCPVGDARGSLRDLAAFAPLGLLGALAAAGGPAMFAGKPVELAPPAGVSGDPSLRTDPGTRGDVETRITEPARNAGDVPAARLGNSNVPIPISPDSLRGGIRAPNTGTPLPSAFLIGSGLIAIGCVAITRSRG